MVKEKIKFLGEQSFYREINDYEHITNIYSVHWQHFGNDGVNLLSVSDT